MDHKNLKFGIVQGRLTQAPKGCLQWFPQKDWEKEFKLASTNGYHFIEFIAERDHNPNNPIWSDPGIALMQKLAKENNLIVDMFCNDYIINHSLLDDTQVLKQAKDLVIQTSKLGSKKMVLPLFEVSELSYANYKSFKPALTELAETAKKYNIELCLETILNGNELKECLEYFDNQNIKCVFDTGNRIAHGHNIYEDIITLDSKISHVHIKDKDIDHNNVLLGTGLVNFKKVFKSLFAINYKGYITFETTRGCDPIKTAQFNKYFIEYYAAEGACYED